MASDVYAVGATLLFAATGHPPYRGATVLDVLARLATEDPDLSGLPDELAGLVGACLARVPRQRPTSSAILAQLGDFTEAQVGPDEEHSYLPEMAMALIGEYQRNPQLAALRQPDEDPGEDATSASYTELPASVNPLPRKYQPRRPPPGDGRRGAAGSRWGRWFRPRLAWAGWASASGPSLCMVTQSLGTAAMSWIVRGHGFAPGTPVTVSLIWEAPPLQGAGTFDRTARVRPLVTPASTTGPPGGSARRDPPAGSGRRW